jgi:hypothetical protein
MAPGVACQQQVSQPKLCIVAPVQCTLSCLKKRLNEHLRRYTEAHTCRHMQLATMTTGNPLGRALGARCWEL